MIAATTTVLTITRCGKCPFSGAGISGPMCDFESVTADDESDEKYTWTSGGDSAPVGKPFDCIGMFGFNIYPKPPPDWCPLIGGKVMIQVESET